MSASDKLSSRKRSVASSAERSIDEAPRRPALRWHGGKWRLAPWIIAQFPPHRCYVEPFGGAASVLLRKPRAYAEVYNDLDDEVVGLFRVLQDPMQVARLRALLEVTPFARREFQRSYEASDDPVVRAQRLIARSFMGFGSGAHASRAAGHRSTGFRSNTTRAGTTPAKDWSTYPEILPALAERFRGVVIEHRDAVDVMARHDGPETLHYVDPPYQHDLRASGDGLYRLNHRYRHELDQAGHAALLTFLAGLAGAVVLSGYPSITYDQALPGWERIETSTHADGARDRTEVLWINPAAAARRRAQILPLFSQGGHA